MDVQNTISLEQAIGTFDFFNKSQICKVNFTCTHRTPWSDHRERSAAQAAQNTKIPRRPNRPRGRKIALSELSRARHSG